MRYEGSVYRPPSEANSLIVQVTIGCAHNQCTFCSMYKDKKFRIRPLAEVWEDLQWARDHYHGIEKIFLADGDALVLSNKILVEILDRIKILFPECKRIGVYGSPQDVLRKSAAELEELEEKGIGILYIGAESGSDRVLANCKKGATASELIEAVKKIEKAGINASVTFISGLAGKEGWREHAIETGKMISQMEPSYVGLLTLMVEGGTELSQSIQSGEFTLLSPEEVLQETELLLQNIQLTKSCVFRSNHASNYLALKGNLPEDGAAMLEQVRRAKKNSAMLKDERDRLL